MSRAPWAPQPALLRGQPQTAALAALDHLLHIVVAALAAAHEGQPEERPELHQARGIARVARTLQSQIDAYRRLIEEPVDEKSAEKRPSAESRRPRRA